MSSSVLREWKNIMLKGDSHKLKNIIHENAVFYSPVVFTPQIGKKNVLKYLSTAIKVFEKKNFSYIRYVEFDNALYAEFTATIDDIEINGVDFIRIEDQLIKEFKVFIRPIKGLEKVWSKMRNNFN